MVVEEGTTKGKASVSKAIHSMGSDGFPQECLWVKHLLERHAPVFLGDGIGRGTSSVQAAAVGFFGASSTEPRQRCRGQTRTSCVRILQRQHQA